MAVPFADDVFLSDDCIFRVLWEENEEDRVEEK